MGRVFAGRASRFAAGVFGALRRGRLETPRREPEGEVVGSVVPWRRGHDPAASCDGREARVHLQGVGESRRVVVATIVTVRPVK